MHKILLITIFISIGLCATPILSAQIETENILYEQGFADPGFPSGWTTNDLSGQDVIWSWCADPTTGEMNGCPKIWDDPTNVQIPFNATSAENGFLTLSSNSYEGISNPHVSQLTSPIFDFSAEDTVWVKFETHLGAFTITPNNNAILRVLDNSSGTMTTLEVFNCFPEFPEFPEEPNEDNRWSDNPKTIYFNVSEVATFQSSISFQWQWTGQGEYHWSVDDFQVSGSDPRPEVDLILKEKAFLIPENAMTPIFEVAPISFGAKMINQGSQPQSDTKMVIDIFNNNNQHVFSDTLLYETIAVDQESDLIVFATTFTPPNNAAIYEGIYTILPTSPDATPENNIQNFTFEISGNIIAKERQVIPRRSTSPLNNEWTDLEPHSWTWGNYFFIKNGQGKLATSATFSIPNADVLGGKGVNLTLFEWTDLDNNRMSEFTERNLVAFGQYDITGLEPGDGFISVPLVAFPTTALKNNQGYLLMLEYFADNVGDVDLFINYSEEQDYETTVNYLETSGSSHYASMLGIGNPLSEVTYSSLAFGFDRIPMIRLETEEIVGLQNILPGDFKVEISPNPTTGDIGIDFDFPETVPTVSLHLYNQSGKLLITKDLATIQNERSVINGRKLAAGIYYLEIITDAGRRTMRVLKIN